MYEEPVKAACKIDQEILEIESREEILEKYPLLGCVMSIKECIYMKNCPNTGGLHINLNRVATQEPRTIQKLREKGAVLTCRGNVPQFLMSMESNNSIYGLTKNPFDNSRTAGGSSGGEAVNIVQGFANIAIGSDLAGSVRIPALFCGLTGFKPSNNRVSSHCMGFMFERRFGSDQNHQDSGHQVSFRRILR